jgi:hypothetical protein
MRQYVVEYHDGRSWVATCRVLLVPPAPGPLTTGSMAAVLVPLDRYEGKARAAVLKLKLIDGTGLQAKPRSTSARR